MLEAAEPFPTTRSALQGFAVDGCLFTGPKSSTVYQAGAGAALFLALKFRARFGRCAWGRHG